ncbi:pentapeptide repeat-containing protein [Gordonia alkaliphila]|uniref:pentapeptide repeat-containing protein n=1 Tax=Gordonia alkaliphila TaxID=1053547 RepID=UPI001FF4892F|nr:pentapeptide repeat-containing protein [Gordonia alkaliphila]MCK0438785.1 pentapeptide repeat-containing protein [Gordonia alkaliphila]
MAAHPTAPKKPRIEKLTLGGLDDGDPADLQAFAHVERCRFSDLELADVDLSGLTIADCELTTAAFDDVELGGAKIFDSALANVIAPRWSMARGSIRNVRVNGSRIGALDLFEAKIRSVELTDCKLGLVNFRGSDVRDVAFRDCQIDELDLTEATATRVSFENCRIGTLQLQGATLADVDLRDAAIDNLRHLDGLRGAAFTPDQVVRYSGHFAAHLGIVVA